MDSKDRIDEYTKADDFYRGSLDSNENDNTANADPAELINNDTYDRDWDNDSDDAEGIDGRSNISSSARDVDFRNYGYPKTTV